MFSVIFDMDGTLLDTQKIAIPAWDYAGELQGKSQVGVECIPHVCGMNEAGWTAFLLNRHPDIDADRFKADARRYIAENLKVAFMPGAKELLDFLKENGIKIGIASGSSRQTVEHHLREVDAIDYFDTIVGGKEVENGKPAPDIFLLTAERMGVDTAECFVFEDSANGVRAGCAAGMKTIGVSDIVDFPEDVKKIMYAELNSLYDAIALFCREYNLVIK